MEDLRMMRTEVEWAKRSELAVETNATLEEAAKLKRLTTLKISIKDFDCVQEDVFYQLWSKLKKFQVQIGPFEKYLVVRNLMKQVRICNGNNYPHGVKVMVSHAECLLLDSADGQNVSQLVGVSKNLRMLRIEKCEKMECILDWSDGENALQNIERLYLYDLGKLRKLFEGEVSEQCLQQLRKIEVQRCIKLKSLFSSKTVKNLDQLKELYVQECDELEEIIEGNEFLPENPFPQLRSLVIWDSRNLRRIIDRAALSLPSLTDLGIKYVSGFDAT